MKVSFCEFNEQKEGAIKVIREKYPQFEVSITRCLYCCGECSDKPIARISGRLFIGEDTENLVNKLIEFSKSKACS